MMAVKSWSFADVGRCTGVSHKDVSEDAVVFLRHVVKIARGRRTCSQVDDSIEDKQPLLEKAGVGLGGARLLRFP